MAISETNLGQEPEELCIVLLVKVYKVFVQCFTRYGS